MFPRVGWWSRPVSGSTIGLSTETDRGEAAALRGAGLRFPAFRPRSREFA